MACLVYWNHMLSLEPEFKPMVYYLTPTSGA